MDVGKDMAIHLRADLIGSQHQNKVENSVRWMVAKNMQRQEVFVVVTMHDL
jgi:hypothetical protein